MRLQSFSKSSQNQPCRPWCAQTIQPWPWDRRSFAFRRVFIAPFASSKSFTHSRVSTPGRSMKDTYRVREHTMRKYKIYVMESNERTSGSVEGSQVPFCDMSERSVSLMFLKASGVRRERSSMLSKISLMKSCCCLLRSNWSNTCKFNPRWFVSGPLQSLWLSSDPRVLSLLLNAFALATCLLVLRSTHWNSTQSTEITNANQAPLLFDERFLLRLHHG